ncbi:MAG: hypothetical protein ACYCOU_06410 [Sulfobacillus sp.]
MISQTGNQHTSYPRKDVQLIEFAHPDSIDLTENDDIIPAFRVEPQIRFHSGNVSTQPGSGFEVNLALNCEDIPANRDFFFRLQDSPELLPFLKTPENLSLLRELSKDRADVSHVVEDALGIPVNGRKIHAHLGFAVQKYFYEVMTVSY